MERRELLKSFHRLLKTADGELLMDELKSYWMDPNPLDENAQVMGFNIGLQQAYRQLEAWRNGEGLDV